jgi:hypothetical protein
MKTSQITLYICHRKQVCSGALNSCISSLYFLPHLFSKLVVCVDYAWQGTAVIYQILNSPSLVLRNAFPHAGKQMNSHLLRLSLGQFITNHVESFAFLVEMRRLKIFSFLSLLIYLFSEVNKDDFLCSFAKLRKETISVVMPVRLYFRMKQLGSH